VDAAIVANTSTVARVGVAFTAGAFVVVGSAGGADMRSVSTQAVSKVQLTNNAKMFRDNQ
jgi:hypothetical protein